jgi:16S rRNA (uracil1498-N3)-methyltransferase
MSERFFIPSPPVHGRVVLTGDEARHLVRVLRGQVGDDVVVFSGAGVEWPAQITRLGRDEAELAVGPARPDPDAVDPEVSIAVALPKGERQKWLVEKLTEFGVARLIPLETERGVAEATPAACERLRRGVIEACKQCGRNRLMEIGEPRSVATALADMPPGSRTVIADRGGISLEPRGLAVNTTSLLALVGPEGGFTAAEIAAAEQAGAIRVGLGPHILRIETAAIALAARLAVAGR